MKRITKILALVLALIFTVSVIPACTGGNNGGNDNTPAPAPDDGNNKTQVGIRPANGTGYTASGELSHEFVSSFNRTSINLIRSMGDGWTGVISPVSFAMMLNLLSNGASDETKAAILSAIGIDLGMTESNENAARIMAAFSGKEISRKLSSDAQVRLLNAILVNSGDRFNPDFEGIAADYYNSFIGSIDFSNNAAAVETINSWISKNTEGLIPTLFDDISPDTTMALLNAVYFNASWATPFTAFKGEGISSMFNGVNGQQAVTMLQNVGEYSYGEFNGHKVVLVPYAGGEYCMAIVLPENGSTPIDALDSVIDNFDSCEKATVRVQMPAVNISSRFDVLEKLSAFGLEGIADGSTQFPAIVDGASIRLTQFKHAAVLNVTEKGTEAAAASGVTGTKSAAPIINEPEYSVICDRPYAMAIVHIGSGTILFASVVNDIPAN